MNTTLTSSPTASARPTPSLDQRKTNPEFTCSHPTCFFFPSHSEAFTASSFMQNTMTISVLAMDGCDADMLERIRAGAGFVSVQLDVAKRALIMTVRWWVVQTLMVAHILGLNRGRPRHMHGRRRWRTSIVSW